MNQLSQKDMKLHVTILGWILIAGHVLGLLIAGFIFFLLTSIGVVSGDEVAFSIFSIVGAGVGICLALLSLPGVLAGYGLLTRRGWGRILALVVAAFGLLNFPIGTIIGLYAFWVLLQQEASLYFES